MNSLIRHFKLHRQDFFISIVAGLVVAVVMLAVYLRIGRVAASSLPHDQNHASNGTQPLQILSDQSSLADVVALMRNSQNQWQSLDLSATTIWYGPQGDTQTVNTTVQIQQFAQARVRGQQTAANGDLMADFTWVSDGKMIYEQNNLAKRYTEHVLPEYAQSPVAAAAVATRIPPDAVFRQPMAILMPTGLGDYIYPSGLMQRKGTVTIDGSNKVAGRPVIVIRWDGAGNPARYWVDAGTGLILRAETFGGDGPEGVFEETTVTRVTYAQTLAPETFAFQPLPGAKFISYDEWVGPVPK